MRVGRWKRVVMALAVALMAGAFCGCAAQQQQVAARFGDHVITEDEVTAYTVGYRAQNGLQDDEDWKSYVSLSYHDTKTWREEAIRVLADKVLIEEKAVALGISADEERVAGTISEEKEKAGIASDDEQAWTEYLAEHGTTPQEHRETLEYSSIEEQVYRSELNFTDELQSEMCTDYIKAHYADQVMHHYWAIPFDLGDGEAAQACLDELKGLSGDALRTRFVELYGEAVDGSPDAVSYDIGWDFLYSEGDIDPEIRLRNSNLYGGDLYDGVLEGTDKLRVALCDERVELVDPDYDKIESESFKNIISAYTLATTWAAECRNYLTELEQAADIQVVPMPDGLPYAVD